MYRSIMEYIRGSKYVHCFQTATLPRSLYSQG